MVDEPRPRAAAKVQVVTTADPVLEAPKNVGKTTPKPTACTALLDDALFTNLGKLQHELPRMEEELRKLKEAVDQMRTAEAACATTTDDSSTSPIEKREQARSHLQHQIQRVQMVLQGRKNDLDTYQPNIRQVSHLGQRQAHWTGLKRALKSLARVPEPAPQQGPATQPDTIAALIQTMVPSDLPPSPALERLRSSLHEPLLRRRAVLNDLGAQKGSDQIRETRLQADLHNVQKDLFGVLNLYIISSYKELPKNLPARQTLEETAERLYTVCNKLRLDLRGRPSDLQAAGLVLVADEFQRADATTGKAREPIRPLRGQRLG